MANAYYDLTGVLQLQHVTPVIGALFGPFRLEKDYPGGGEVYIAKIAENEPSWDDIQENLGVLVAELGLSLSSDAEGNVADHLRILASHFGMDQDPGMLRIIEGIDECDVDLGVLFGIARRFNDGHGLKAMKIEGCWHCDKPRLFHFGGNGEYYGEHIYVGESSITALHLGADVDEALGAGDLSKASERLLREVNTLLNGVKDEVVRASLRAKLSEGLNAPE